MKISSASTFLICIPLLILAFSFAFCAPTTPTCNPQELVTLHKINAAFGIDNPSGDCCDWNFVVCDNRPPFPVTELNYVGNFNITGEIPDALADLKSIVLLRFINLPNLTGNIPPAITKLPLLNKLIISQTGLSGKIPTFLINIKELSFLDLSMNSFTGSIPSELSQFPKLASLDLIGNKLTGTIPESLGYFKSEITNLFLSRNSLTGTIPKSFGNLNLQVLDLSGNHLSGDPSFLFGKNSLVTIQTLRLNENNFSFDLSNAEFGRNLTELDLSHNNIFGSLPKQLTEIFLHGFDVSYNKLCGVIPKGGQLQKFGIVSYVNNKCLCGSPLPACK